MGNLSSVILFIFDFTASTLILISSSGVFPFRRIPFRRMPCKLFFPSFSFLIPFTNVIQPFYRHFLFRKISKWHGFSANWDSAQWDSAKRDSAKWGITASSRSVSAPLTMFSGNEMLTTLSSVKTDENWSLKTSAMALASLTCCQLLTLSGATCILLLVLLLAYVKNDFLSSFIFCANLCSKCHLDFLTSTDASLSCMLDDCCLYISCVLYVCAAQHSTSTSVWTCLDEQVKMNKMMLWDFRFFMWI